MLFSGVVGSILGARKREKQSANPIWIPIRFCDDSGIIVGVILEARIVHKSMWILNVLSEGPQGGLRKVSGVKVDRVAGGPGER